MMMWAHEFLNDVVTCDKNHKNACMQCIDEEKSGLSYNSKGYWELLHYVFSLIYGDVFMGSPLAAGPFTLLADMVAK